MKTIRVFAIALALALGVAFIPALASASTTPTTYTKSYAGYYVKQNIGGGYLLGTVHLPYFSQLAKVTNGITAEIRITSSVGEWDMQFGANPQTAQFYTVRFEHGSTNLGCYSQGVFSQGDTVNFEADINYQSEDYPSLDLFANDVYGNWVSCSTRPASWWPGPSYSQVAIVDAFNAKTFHQPPSAVALANWNNLDWEYGGGTTLASHSPGRYIATSTGTATGTKRAVPSAIDSTGSGFTVTIP